jgi:acetyl-CoA decarbonylase/synthase complex subunit alpha
MVMIAKLCMRPNDTGKGRAIKLTHYIDLHQRLFGTLPDDICLFVRTMTDVPITMKGEITKVLRERGWKETIIPDPTMLTSQLKKQRST